MSPILTLQGFGVSFMGRTVLRSLDLQVQAKGCTVLLGPSGTGKSTLLRSLAGLNPPSASTRIWCLVLYDTARFNPDFRPALVQQKAQLLMSSVSDNLVSGLPQRSRLSRTAQLELVEAALHQFGQAALASKLAEQVIDLPVHEQRIVAIARQGLARPALLLVDEPTANLAPDAAAQVLQVLRIYIKMIAQNPGSNVIRCRVIPGGRKLKLNKKPLTQPLYANPWRIKKPDLAQHLLKLPVTDIKTLKLKTVSNNAVLLSKITITVQVTENLNGYHHLTSSYPLLQTQLFKQYFMKTVMLNSLKKSLLRPAFIGKIHPSFSRFTRVRGVITLLKRTFTETLNRPEHIVTFITIAVISRIAGSVLSFFNKLQQRIFLQLLINPLFKVHHRKLKKLAAQNLLSGKQLLLFLLKPDIWHYFKEEESTNAFKLSIQS